MAPRSRAELEERLATLTRERREELTLDALTRDFVLFQRRRGHRTSTDDLLTAWYAATKSPAPKTMLDLGTGIGSVGLYLAWLFDRTPLTAIEVQDVSFALLRENVWANGVEDRVRILHGDLRELPTFIGDERFELVTGSPPYFDIKAGIVSADSQRAGARFELRGDVNDYCRAAKSALTDDGRFVFCFPTVQRERAVRAVSDAGLALVALRDVVPRAGIAPLFSLFLCRRDACEPQQAVEVEAPLAVRDADGKHTAEMLSARAVFGMG